MAGKKTKPVPVSGMQFVFIPHSQPFGTNGHQCTRMSIIRINSKKILPMIIQLCGLSGAGKTTLTFCVKEKLKTQGVNVEIIDGDEYRRMFCRDLGFSREDRLENIRRLAFIASKFSAHGIVALISAINPYQELRNELKSTYCDVQTVFIDCPLEVLIARDTKGLYKRALLPPGHPEKINNLTGVNDPFDVPGDADLTINTSLYSLEESVRMFSSFILQRLSAQAQPVHHSAYISAQQ